MTPVEIARLHVTRRTPWKHQARGPKSLDCIGLLIVCFRQCGVTDRTNYDRKPNRGQLESCVREQFGPPIPKAEIQEGDIALLAFRRSISHVGIIAKHPRKGLSLIHTWNGGPGRVCETPLDQDWMDRIKLVHRLTVDEEN